MTLAGLLAILFGGLFLAVWYGKDTKKFSWKEYAAVAALPSLSLLWVWYRMGIVALYLYVITCISGPILEYVLGWAYHKTIGKRLWTYNKSYLNGYTSFLVIPYWGLVGICVLALTEIVR